MINYNPESTVCNINNQLVATLVTAELDNVMS